MNVIKIAEDRAFLIDQRGERKMIMTSIDKKLEKVKERSLKRKQRSEELRKMAAKSNASSSVVSSQELGPECNFSSTSSDASILEDKSKDDFVVPVPKKTKSSSSSCGVEPSTSGIFTQHVTSAFDRNKITDREAMRLIIPLSAALGCNPASLPISRSSIRRARKKARTEYNSNIKKKCDIDSPLVVHWDGKLMPDITGKKKVKRLPILVSGNGCEKLLGVPKLVAGTGKQISDAVFDTVRQWNITNKIQAMSLDTTASNTGARKGACVFLEEKTGHDLSWLACRHHVFEIMLSKIFTLCFGPSSSPQIPLFKRFCDIWETLPKEHYDCLNLDENALQFAENTLESLTTTLSGENQVRDEYEELINLTMIVLNKPPAKIHWRAPGPIHHARWMAKLLYALKIFLFRINLQAFKLTKREENKFFDLLALVRSSTLKYGLYKAIDSEIGKAARGVLERRLWYLSDELVALALFSEKLSDSDKQAIVQKMNSDGGNRSVRGESAKLTSEVTLEAFVTQRTLKTLSALDIKDSFLELPTDTWNDNEIICKARAASKNCVLSMIQQREV
ncbi:hypothetical protein EVAR_77281_1 [Eumeta japonica]|uniref:Uncharacterized protein n=1 Tax=Eumeta variegata TaxID=151549 RepID=A0A4C1UME3_EUMVA|nr:hypothetical protein EVAR_77281_1 [Eumeta japonica]